MGQASVQYGGGEAVRTKKVYYAGATALKKNQPLAYVENAKTFLPEDDPSFSGSTNTADRGLSRGVLVETPATASIPFFAGILQDGEEGKSASWVTILVPSRDQVMNVRVESTTDIAVGDHLAQVDGQPYLTHQGFDAETSKFYALEARTDNSQGIILAKRL